MSKGPEWYRNLLNRKQRDMVDQTLHFVLIGFLPSILFSAAPSFAYTFWREFVKQLPIDRLDDTIRDTKFCMIGACVGQVFHTAGWIWLALPLIR